MLDIGLQREIARRIAIEEKLRESEARFNQVAENIEGLVFQRHKDADGGYSYCFFGNTADSMVAWRKVGDDNPMPHRFGRVHPDDWGRLSAELEACIKNETDLQTEYRTVTSGGRIRFVRSQSKVRHTEDGVSVWDGVIFDVTDLVLARQKADAAIASQRRMLSNINHDLRNPLTAIIGYGDISERWTAAGTGQKARRQHQANRSSDARNGQPASQLRKHGIWNYRFGGKTGPDRTDRCR